MKRMNYSSNIETCAITLYKGFFSNVTNGMTSFIIFGTRHTICNCAEDGNYYEILAPQIYASNLFSEKKTRVRYYKFTMQKCVRIFSLYTGKQNSLHSQFSINPHTTRITSRKRLWNSIRIKKVWHQPVTGQSRSLQLHASYCISYSNLSMPPQLQLVDGIRPSICCIFPNTISNARVRKRQPTFWLRLVDFRFFSPTIRKRKSSSTYILRNLAIWFVFPPTASIWSCNMRRLSNALLQLVYAANVANGGDLSWGY